MKNNLKKRVLIIFGVVLVLFSSPLLSNNNSNKIVGIDFNKKMNTSSTPSVDWYSMWGGAERDWGNDIVMDGSGNAYVAGETHSFGEGAGDMCFVKFNSTGGVEWNKTWGGTGYDEGNGIAIDAAGNTYVTGFTDSFGTGSYEMFLVKFNPTGGVEWSNTWGSGGDGGYGVAVDALGNAYVTGWTRGSAGGNADLCLVKFNPTGGVEWNNTWGGNGADWGNGVAVDAAGNAYVTGRTFGTDNYDVCLVKFNSTGGVEWNNTWGGSGYDEGWDVTVDTSSNAYVAGNTEGYSYNICLLKFNPTGDVVWYSTWDSSGIDYGKGVALDTAGNAYVTGYTAFDSDICLVKFNPTGEVVWYTTWGGIWDDSGWGIALDASGNIYVTGCTGSFGDVDGDLCLVKFIEVPSEDGTQVPDPLLFLIIGSIIGGIAGGSGIIAIVIVGIVRPRRKRVHAVHAN